MAALVDSIQVPMHSTVSRMPEGGKKSIPSLHDSLMTISACASCLPYFAPQYSKAVVIHMCRRQ